MPISLPSKKIAIVDAPEVPSFSSEFVYGFFLPDERTNDSGVVEQKFIQNRSAESFDIDFIDSFNFRRFIPRFNRITWQPSLLGNGDQSLSRIKIADNLKKIYNEVSFAPDDFTSIQFQDSGADEKLAYFIRRAVEEIRQLTEIKEGESVLDVAKFTNRNTSKGVTPNFIANSFGKLSLHGQRFLDIRGKEVSPQSVLDQIAGVSVRSQINNKLLSKIMKTTGENTVNIFNDDLEPLLKEAQIIQERAISESPSSVMEGRDYDFEVRDFVKIEPIDTNGFESVSTLIGYIINKTEFTTDGDTKVHVPITVESPFVNSYADLKIKYGSSYEYTIQSVSLFKVQAEDVESNEVVALSFLVSSKESSITRVQCEEFTPPPPPTDFNIEWDYVKTAPRLMWTFPPNSQRDIKYFQVFRRENTNQPFEMIKMYDFDDSQVLSEYNETPEDFLIEKVTSPVSLYMDTEFTKESNYIYTVCSVDAHGFSSNYSVQYDIGFNRFNNRLEKEILSPSGAPKAYPNMYLLTDTFVDSIRSSGHKKMTVIFNPEYLKVVDSNDNDLELLKTGENTTYRIQMINVDLQEQQDLDICLLDKRKSTEKNNDNTDV